MSILRSLRSYLPFLGLILFCTSALAQRSTSKPIDLDRELRPKVAPNRANSYYHFALSKLAEHEGNLAMALAEMQNALDYNPDSASINMELAYLSEKSGSISDAIDHAVEAARLDPDLPDPHWLLANIYYPQEGGATAKEGITKAIQELEKIRQLAPKDERVYAALGEAYFKLNQPDKAIQAYEQYQSMASGTDKGYQEIAKYYASTGKEEKAIEYCLKGLEAQPDSPESLWLLSQLYGKLNKDKEAVPVYRKLLGIMGDNLRIKEQFAATLIEANQSGEAAGLLQEVLKAAPGEMKAKVLLGRAQMDLHQYSEAIETLQSVMKSAPASTDAVDAAYYLGIAYERSGEYNEAAKTFAGLLENPAVNSEEIKSNKILFQQRLAYVYEELKENQKAIAVYQEMVKAEPKATSGLVNAYRVDKQYDKALSLGKQYYEKNPDDIRMGVVYARTLADAGKSKEGIELLTKLLQSNPSNIDIYLNLSGLYIKDKRYSEAEKLLRSADESKLKDDEDKERLKFQLAAIYEKQKNFDRAEMLIKEVLKTKPDNAEALNYIGYMLADRGVRLDEAMKYVKEALALEPHKGEYLDSLGWAFFKLNDMGNAEKYLLEAASIIKNDPTIEDHLGDFYFKAGNFEKAQDFWKKSISLGTEEDDIQKVRRKLDSIQEKIRKKK
jgi:tetratricopeptide (TPR) repeat protein